MARVNVGDNVLAQAVFEVVAVKGDIYELKLLEAPQSLAESDIKLASPLWSASPEQARGSKTH